MVRALLPLLGATLLTALAGCAAPPPSPIEAPDTAMPTESPPLEVTRSAVRSTAEWLARGVDGWFGDQPFEDGGKVTDGRFSVGVLHRQDDGTSVNLRFNARFRLPNLEKSAYLFIGRDNPRDVITDKPDTFTRQQRLLPQGADDRRFIAGFGLSPTDALGFRVGFRGGLKPYAQLRYSKPWALSERNLLEFRQTLFWTVDDHVGATAALSYEHALSPTLAARWLNSLTITQVVKKAEWSSGLGVFKAMGEQRLLTLEALANGQQGSGVGATDYGLQTRWEQPLGRDWLLGEVVVGHFWPRPDPLLPRGRAWAIGTTLKLKF